MMFSRPMMTEEGRLNIGDPIKKPQFPFEFWGLVSRLQHLQVQDVDIVTQLAEPIKPNDPPLPA